MAARRGGKQGPRKPGPGAQAGLVAKGAAVAEPHLLNTYGKPVPEGAATVMLVDLDDDYNNDAALDALEARLTAHDNKETVIVELEDMFERLKRQRTGLNTRKKGAPTDTFPEPAAPRARISTNSSRMHAPSRATPAANIRGQGPEPKQQ